MKCFLSKLNNRQLLVMFCDWGQSIRWCSDWQKKKKTSQRCRAFIILRWEQLYNNAPVLMNMTMSVQQSTANLLLKIGDTEAGKWKIERTKWLLQGFSFAAFMLLMLKYKNFSCPELLVVYIPPLKCPEGAKHRSKGKMESDLAPSVMHA